jgi:hypothetical protein
MNKMNKFNDLYNKIILENSGRDFEEAKRIFDKEGEELVNKINDYFKKRGLQCYFTILKNHGIYYFAGFRMRLKFHAEGDKKGRQWWEWIKEVEGMSTKNLIFKQESNSEICLKSTWRPESHRGQVVNLR